jgi:PilZ domain
VIVRASPCTTIGYNSKVNDFGNFRELNLPCNLRLMSNESVNSPGAAKAVRSRYAEVQSAARFPVKLPIHIKSQNGESETESDNISANGVLFHHDVDMPIGSTIDFTISLPAEVVGAEADVQVECRGRVVRSRAEDGRRGVGVVIDEYRFERR